MSKKIFLRKNCCAYTAMNIVKIFSETISGFKEVRSELENLKVFIKENNIKFA